MKKFQVSFISLILSLIIISIILLGCTHKHNNIIIDVKKFKDPPDFAKVDTWWHWMDGNITKEGITRDLEAMSKQGINQVTIFNIGLFKKRFLGLKEVKFNTNEWYEMFAWAL